MALLYHPAFAGKTFGVLLYLLPSFASSQQDESISPQSFDKPDTIVFVNDELVYVQDEHVMVSFSAVDGDSRDTVSANFKIFNKNNDKPLPGANIANREYHTSVNSNEEYVLEVWAPGYLSYIEDFIPNLYSRDKLLHKVVSLERSNFLLKLRAVNGLTQQVIHNAAITLINLTHKETIHTLINPVTGDCLADFDLNSQYSLEVVAQGYLPHTEIFTPIEKSFDKDLVLYPESALQTVRFKAIDATSGKQIDAEISISNQKHGRVPLKIKKDYVEAKLLSGNSYVLTVQSEGYLTLQRDFIPGVSRSGSKEIPVELSKAPVEGEIKTAPPTNELVFKNLESGKSIVLDDVFFIQSKHELKPGSYSELNKLVNTLKQNPALHILIIGHTDNVGDKKLNLLLSQNRAKVIAQYLIDHGIAETRLETKGLGGSQPIAPNDSEENRQKNRRVEFVIK